MPVVSFVKNIQQINRVEHLDEQGGGFVTRQLYVEPYTSYPFVELALKGTLIKNDDDTWSRIKPHADPIKLNGAGKPFFYCSDVKVLPFDPSTARGMVGTGFTPSTDLTVAKTPVGQQAAILDALGNHDSFDFDCNIDLTPAEIEAGGPNYSSYAGQTAFESKGHAGAYIEATYTPVVSLDGIQDDPSLPNYQDPFDFIIGTDFWTPQQRNTQLGRTLQFMSPTGWPWNTYQPSGGVSDTATVPETVYQLKTTRRMIKFVPRILFGMLQSKINFATFDLGNMHLASGTVRFETPSIRMGLTPDGQQYYDVDLIFSVRQVWDEYYDVGDAPDPPDYRTGWVDWNHMIGIPSVQFVGIQNGKLSYYPVGTKTGAFAFFGDFRPLHLYDTQITAGTSPTGAILNIWKDPFSAGWKNGQ
jgi:hypothetical protein